MQKPFTTFAVTRFVDRETVLDSLRERAKRLKAAVPEAAVYLFGSFATGTPTPRSDADIAVIIDSLEDSDSPSNRNPGYVQDVATAVFLDAPVPTEIFVLSRAQIQEGRQTGRGVAGVVARDGILLA